MDKKYTLTIPEIALPFIRQGMLSYHNASDLIYDEDATDEQCITDILSMYACLGGLNPDLCQIQVEEI